MSYQKGNETKWVSDPCANYVSGVFCFTKKYDCHIVMCVLYVKKSACHLIF